MLLNQHDVFFDGNYFCAIDAKDEVEFLGNFHVVPVDFITKIPGIDFFPVEKFADTYIYHVRGVGPVAEFAKEWKSKNVLREARILLIHKSLVTYSDFVDEGGAF